MSQRTGWAVTAAEHMAAALRAISTAQGQVEADLAYQHTDQAYDWSLFCIGTIPSDRREDVRHLTLAEGMAVADALDAVGA